MTSIYNPLDRGPTFPTQRNKHRVQSMLSLCRKRAGGVVIISPHAICVSLSTLLFFTHRSINCHPQPWDRVSTPVHSMQQMSMDASDEIRESKPYGIEVCLHDDLFKSQQRRFLISHLIPHALICHCAASTTNNHFLNHSSHIHLHLHLIHTFLDLKRLLWTTFSVFAPRTCSMT